MFNFFKRSKATKTTKDQSSSVKNNLKAEHVLQQQKQQQLPPPSSSHHDDEKINLDACAANLKLNSSANTCTEYTNNNNKKNNNNTSSNSNSHNEENLIKKKEKKKNFLFDEKQNKNDSVGEERTSYSGFKTSRFIDIMAKGRNRRNNNQNNKNNVKNNQKNINNNNKNNSKQQVHENIYVDNVKKVCENKTTSMVPPIAIEIAKEVTLDEEHQQHEQEEHIVKNNNNNKNEHDVKKNCWEKIENKFNDENDEKYKQRQKNTIHIDDDDAVVAATVAANIKNDLVIEKEKHNENSCELTLNDKNTLNKSQNATASQPETIVTPAPILYSEINTKLPDNDNKENLLINNKKDDQSIITNIIDADFVKQLVLGKYKKQTTPICNNSVTKCISSELTPIIDKVIGVTNEQCLDITETNDIEIFDKMGQPNSKGHNQTVEGNKTTVSKLATVASTPLITVATPTPLNLIGQHPSVASSDTIVLAKTVINTQNSNNNNSNNDDDLDEFYEATEETFNLENENTVDKQVTNDTVMVVSEKLLDCDNAVNVGVERNEFIKQQQHHQHTENDHKIEENFNELCEKQLIINDKAIINDNENNNNETIIFNNDNFNDNKVPLVFLCNNNIDNDNNNDYIIKENQSINLDLMSEGVISNNNNNCEAIKCDSGIVINDENSDCELSDNDNNDVIPLFIAKEQNDHDNQNNHINDKCVISDKCESDNGFVQLKKLKNVRFNLNEYYHYLDDNDEEENTDDDDEEDSANRQNDAFKQNKTSNNICRKSILRKNYHNMDNFNIDKHDYVDVVDDDDSDEDEIVDDDDEDEEIDDDDSESDDNDDEESTEYETTKTTIQEINALNSNKKSSDECTNYEIIEKPINLPATSNNDSSSNHVIAIKIENERTSNDETTTKNNNNNINEKNLYYNEEQVCLPDVVVESKTGATGDKQQIKTLESNDYDDDNTITDGSNIEMHDLVNQDVRFTAQEKTDADDAIQEINENQTKSNELIYKVGELERNLTVKTWNVDRLQAELISAHKECECVKKKIKLQEEALDLLRTKSFETEENLKHKYDELQQENNETLEKLAGMRLLTSNLQEQLVQAQSDLEAYKMKMQILNKTREEEIKTIRDAMNTSKNERDVLETKWKNEFEQLRNMNSDREEHIMEDCEWQLRTMQKKWKEKLDAAEKEKNEMYNNAKAMQEEANRVLNEVVHLKSYEAEVAQLRGLTNDQNNSLKNLSDQLEDVKNELETANSRLNSEIENFIKLKFKTACDYAELERLSAIKIEEVKGETAVQWEYKLLDEMARLKDELESVHMDERREALDKMKTEFEEEIKKLTERFNETEQALEEEIATLKEIIKERNTELEESNTRLDNQIVETRNFIDRMERNHQIEINKEVAYREELIQSLRDEHERDKLEMEERFCERLQDVKHEFGQELMNSKDELNKIHKKKLEDQWKQLITDKEEAIQSMELRHRNRMDDVAHKMKEMETTFQRQIADMKSTYSMERSSLESRDIKNVQEIDTLHRKCRCLTKLFEEMRMRYERRDPRQEDLREIAELKNRVDAQDRDLCKLTERLREMQLNEQHYQQLLNGGAGGVNTQRKSGNNNSSNKGRKAHQQQHHHHHHHQQQQHHLGNKLNCDVIYEENEQEAQQQHHTTTTSTTLPHDDNNKLNDQQQNDKLIMHGTKSGGGGEGGSIESS